jgi:hypothetical protein
LRARHVGRSADARQPGFDAALLPVDEFRTGVSYVSGLNTSRVMTALSGWSRRRVRSRTLPGAVVPASRARLSRRKTQYKCGNSRVWNNHPLGKPRYDQRLLLAPAPWLRWSEMAAETGLSNGAQNACSFHCRWIHDAGRPRDGTAAAGSVPNRGPEGMTRTCKNGVVRRAGTTGA